MGNASEEILTEIFKSAQKVENIAIANVTISGIINRSVVEKERLKIENQKSVLEKANTLLENKKEVLWKKDRAVEALLKERKSEIETPKLGITYRDGKFCLNGILPVEEPPQSKVRKNLQALEKIFEIIGKYNPDIVEFIMEIIMFSFAGSYLWKVRESREVDKTKVPIFGLLAGVSQGGKSLTLQIIEKLTNGMKYEFDKIKIEGARSPAEIVDVYLFDERFGVNPLLIDEIPIAHLTKYALYNKIKSLTNTVENSIHGVVIGAFNIEKGPVPKEILRRTFLRAL